MFSEDKDDNTLTLANSLPVHFTSNDQHQCAQSALYVPYHL